MCFSYLSLTVLQHITLAAVEHAHFAAQNRSRVFARPKSPARCLNPQHFDPLVVDEWVEKDHGVAAAPHTRHQIIRQPSFFFQNLPTRFLPDHGLKVPYNHWVRMRSGHRSDEIISVAYIRYPIA